MSEEKEHSEEVLEEEQKLSSKDRRGLYVALAVVVLLVVYALVKWGAYRHENRPIPPATPTPVDVEVMQAEIGDQPIYITAYGTVQSAQVIDLIAPFAAKVEGSIQPFMGQFIPSSEMIFQLDTRKIDLQIAKYKAIIRALETTAKQLRLQEQLIEEQIASTEDLIKLSQAIFQTRQADFIIQQQLFDSQELLYKSRDISYAAYLQAQEKLNSSQIALLSAEEAVKQTCNALDQLREQLISVRADLKNIPNQIEESMAAIKQQLIDRAKGRVSVPFPSGVVSVGAQAGMEVQMGTPLATVQAVNEVEVPVFIPDIYLKWIYGSPAFATASLQPGDLPQVEIALVNQNFDRVFNDGYVKAIAQTLNETTRSLPLVVGRSNPMNDQGEMVPEDQLKAGMYCSVTFCADKAEGTFLVPIHALQVQGRIYYAEPLENAAGEDQQLAKLGVITDVELVHHSSKGTVIRLPEEYTSLVILTQQLMNAQSGMLIRTHTRSEEISSTSKVDSGSSASSSSER